MRVARVAVEVAPAHLDRPFDYLVPDGVSVRVGQRLRVPFAGRTRPGWVVGRADAAEVEALQEIGAVDGPWSWFDEDDLALYRWVADRYASTLAAVLRHAIPARVAAVDAEALGIEHARDPSLLAWGDPPAWSPADRPPCPAQTWRPYGASALLKAAAGRAEPAAFWWRVLPGDDRAAMAADLVARCLSGGRSALVLSADPGSPLARLALDTAGSLGADLRGSVPDRARYRAALRCRTGHARVAVGGRAAIFAPLRDIGLVLVEDEANPAYKERRSPRHHAREVALARARLGGATAVLLGDLPSAALWRLVSEGHVRRVAADRATERERAPRVDVIDLGDPRPGARRARFEPVAARALTGAVSSGGAAIVLTARRGDGAALACGRCGRRRACPVCDGALSSRVDSAAQRAAQSTQWSCTTCGWAGAPFACSSCGALQTAPLAAGAGRLAAELARSYPEAEVVRMEGFDAPGPTRRPAIAVMTRGSVVDRPAWLRGEQAAVVVVPDADALLGRPALEAGEDALRLWFAAGLVTRRIVLQTREPANPAVQALVRWDPEGFWRREVERRAELAWPPHSSLIRLTGDAPDEVAVAVRGAVPPADEVLGPDAGGTVLVKSRGVRGTLRALMPLRQDWGKRSVRVRIDVDPT